MQHIDLNNGRWAKLTFVEQMANVGSEIERALKWNGSKRQEYAHFAHERALELFDLTLSSTHQFSILKEVARARELWLDFFVGENQYKQTARQWHNYFFSFTYAARNKSFRL